MTSHATPPVSPRDAGPDTPRESRIQASTQRRLAVADRRPRGQCGERRHARRARRRTSRRGRPPDCRLSPVHVLRVGSHLPVAPSHCFPASHCEATHVRLTASQTWKRLFGHGVPSAQERRPREIGEWASAFAHPSRRPPHGTLSTLGTTVDDLREPRGTPRNAPWPPRPARAATAGPPCAQSVNSRTMNDPQLGPCRRLR